MGQLLGIVVGLISGVVWEILVNTPYKNFSTLFSSVYVDRKVHLHHWVWYVAIFTITILWAYKADRIIHPSVLFIIAFLIGALAYGFWKFPDWVSF